MTDDAIMLPTFDTVEQYVHTAVSEGLSSPAVCPYLDRMGFDVSAFDPLTREVEAGAELSPERVRERRLTCVERLGADIANTTPVSAD